MDKSFRFSKIKVEKTLDHFFSPQGGRMVRVNNDEVSDSRYNKSVVPSPGTFSNRNNYPNGPTMYKSNASQISTEMMQQCMPNNTAGYANNFDQSKCVQGEEYTSHYYHGNNQQLESNLSNEQQAREYCNNMRNSTSYEETGPYFFPKKYKSDDQLIQNTMYYQDGKSQNPRDYRDDDAPRNGPRFGEHFNTQRSIDDEWLSHSQRHDELAKNNFFPTKMNDFDRNFERFKRNRMEVSDEHHFQTNPMPMQPSPRPSFDRSNNYNRLSRANENVRRFRSISGERQPIQKLDDGFVCVRNPDFFPDSRGDNEHVSRDTRNAEQHRSNAQIKNNLKLSQDRSFTRDRINRSRSPNYNRKTGKGKQYERVKKFQESIKEKRENSKRNRDVGEAQTKKEKTDDNPAHEDISFRKYHWKKGDNTINPKNWHSHNSKYTYIKKQYTRGIPKQTLPKEKRVSKAERKKFYVKINLQPTIAVNKPSRKQAKNRLEKQKELLAVGLFGTPCEGHIKYHPEKYWTTWWSKYAYVENDIDKVDADSLADHLKFRCDLNDPTLDSKINHIYNTALTQIKLTSTITEMNYERRTDAYSTLKCLKILEDKEFQSFLVTKESKHIGEVLKEERENKRRQALMYQSIIYSWHNAKLLEQSESEETSSGDIFNVQLRKQAKSLQKDELYHYMVLDSINELKKLTAEDWPGFEDFYKTLK